MARRRQSAWQLSRAESRPAERTGSCRHQLGTDSLPPACHWTSLVPAAAAELGSPAMMKEDIVPSLLRSAFKTNWSEGTVEERAGRGACTGVTCVTLAVCVPGSAATFARRMGKHLHHHTAHNGDIELVIFIITLEFHSVPPRGKNRREGGRHGVRGFYNILRQLAGFGELPLAKTANTTWSSPRACIWSRSQPLETRVPRVPGTRCAAPFQGR